MGSSSKDLTASKLSGPWSVPSNTVERPQYQLFTATSPRNTWPLLLLRQSHRSTLPMSSTSDTRHYKTKACLPVDLIEGLFTAFAQRRFEKNSIACLLPPFPSSHRFDHRSSEWCDRSELKDEPTECHGSSSSHQNSSPPFDTSLPADSINHRVLQHRLCMIYNNDPDGVASTVADSKHTRLLSAIVH
jgi:hypothetical protein